MKTDKTRIDSEQTNEKTVTSRGRIGHTETRKFKAEARKIVETLGLRWKPIAGKFTSKAGVGDSTLKLSVCEALDVAKTEETVLILSKENCNCFGGKHFTGMEIIPLENIASVLSTDHHKVAESKEAALTSLRKQPQPVKRGDFLTLGPLEKFETEPEIIFLFANPAQADRMLGLVSFRGAQPFTYYPASNICSTITNVLAKNKPEINLIAMFERKARKWSPNELILAMPLKDFREAVENIPKSAYGTFGTKPAKTEKERR